MKDAEVQVSIDQLKVLEEERLEEAQIPVNTNEEELKREDPIVLHV